MKDTNSNAGELMIAGDVASLGKFTLKSENAKHVFRALRGGMYPDKMLAVIREYSTNAQDEHAKHGISRPIEITLPLQNSNIFDTQYCNFCVRDFGDGLSPEGMVDIFCSYGESDKRNDNITTGMLGFGSKSGFAYGDSFTVISRHNGMMYNYSMVIGEDELGDILLMSKSECNEPSGLEIVIPIQHEDIHLFRQKAIAFYKYFNPKPIIHNLLHDTYKHYTELSKTAKFTGANWEYYDGRSASVLVMGNISYPIPVDQIKRHVDEKILTIFKNGLVIFADIGAVDFASSRESLQYTKKTINYLVDIANLAGEKIIEEIKNSVNKCTNLTELSSLYVNYKSSSLKSFIEKADIKWRNFDFNHKFPFTFSDKYKISHFNQISHLKTLIDDTSTLFKTFDIATGYNCLFVLIDKQISNYKVFTSKLRCNFSNREVYFIESDDNFAQFHKDYPLHSSMVVESSKILSFIISHNSRSHSGNISIYSKKCVVFNGDNNDTKSKNWRALTDGDLDKSNIIYYNIDGYCYSYTPIKAIDGIFFTSSHEKCLYEYCKNTFGDDFTILGIKRVNGVFRKPESDWKHPITFLEEQISKNEDLLIHNYITRNDLYKKINIIFKLDFKDKEIKNFYDDLSKINPKNTYIAPMFDDSRIKKVVEDAALRDKNSIAARFNNLESKYGFIKYISAYDIQCYMTHNNMLIELFDKVHKSS